MISSLSNEKVKKWMKLYIKKYREDSFLIISEKITKIAYEQGFLQTLIYIGNKPFDFDEAYEVSKEVMDKLTKGENCNYIGIGKKKELAIKDENNRILLLDNLQDPLNIGKIINCAYLFGFDAIYLSKGSADIYHEKSVLLSEGAIFKMSIQYVKLQSVIAELQSKAFKVYATGLKENNYELNDVKVEEKMAFVLGNEGSGVSEEIMNIVDGIIKIDMCNIDSLNVAMAGAIVMYYFQPKICHKFE